MLQGGRQEELEKFLHESLLTKSALKKLMGIAEEKRDSVALAYIAEALKDTKDEGFSL